MTLSRGHRIGINLTALVCALSVAALPIINDPTPAQSTTTDTAAPAVSPCSRAAAASVSLDYPGGVAALGSEAQTALHRLSETARTGGRVCILAQDADGSIDPEIARSRTEAVKAYLALHGVDHGQFAIAAPADAGPLFGHLAGGETVRVAVLPQ